MPDVPGFTLLPQPRRTLSDAILLALSVRDPDAYRDATVAASAAAFVSKARLEGDWLPAIHRRAAREPRRGTA